ncbi:hypothetical protein GOP47_0001917 [Adiantum capillus-veneris]|uniref:Uncharacterized protein n=1 Tax=Adiantum capillus-veneris TaxID=13818 RepID=A0A9D4V9V7_ADICA|nr:hypothetical protein GOP47_0001917 [Adiantum capillus-veneris]
MELSMVMVNLILSMLLSRLRLHQKRELPAPQRPNPWLMTGRDPTPYECKYAGKKGLNALMDILSSHGRMNPTDTSLGHDETSD